MTPEIRSGRWRALASVVLASMLLAIPARGQANPFLRAQAGILVLRARSQAERGEFDAARRTYEKARALYERAPDAREAANCLVAVGECHESEGDHEAALRAVRTGYDRLREAGDRGLDLHYAVSALSRCRLRLGDPGEALTFAEEALSLARKLYPADHVEVVTALGNVGTCLVALGKPERALPVKAEALAMARRRVRGDDPDLVVALFGHGRSLQALWRLPEALLSFEEAVSMARRLGGRSGDRRLAMCLVGQGSCLVTAGRAAEARRLLEDALAVRRRISSGVDRQLATILHNLGACRLELGHVVEAHDLCREALRTYRAVSPRDHPDTARCLAVLGSCLFDLGRGGDAEGCFVEALRMRRSLFPRDHPDRVASLTTIGVLYDAQGRDEEAMPFHRAAVGMARRLHPGRHPTVAKCLQNLGASLEGAGQPAEAVPVLEEAVARFRELDEPGWTALALSNLAVCLSRLPDRASEARSRYEEAIRIARGIESPETHVYLTTYAGYLLGVDPAAAAGHLTEAIARIEEQHGRARGLEARDRARFLHNLGRFRAYDTMIRAQIALGRADEAVRFVERARARALLDLLDRSRLDPLDAARRRAEETADEGRLARIGEVSSLLAAADREIGRRVHALAAIRARPGLEDAARRALLRSEEKALVVAHRGHREALRQRASLVADEIRPASPASPDAIRGLLHGAERLLVYVILESGCFVLLVPPAGREIRSHRLLWPDGSPATEATVSEAVTHLLRSLAAPGRADRGVRVPGETLPVPEATRVGHRLFRALVPEPVWREIRGSPIVRIVPHGPLHRLPFEALVVKEDRVAAGTRYWLDDGPPLCYGTSASTLLWCRARRDDQIRAERPSEVVALGDARFASGGLTPLPGTRREVEAIRRALREEGDTAPWTVTTLLGEDATCARLRERAPRARILHLATHHLVDESEHASLSRLALTFPDRPTPDDDGFLTLHDLLLHWRARLSGCELVVLSACETQRGALRRDEGVFAMPWGFQVAGCPSVIASLWRVDDESTAELMADFYVRLRSGAGKLEAFTAARRSLRRTRPDPRHWAPFVYIGDPR